MRISFRLHRPKDKSGNLKKDPVSILVQAYSKETGRIEIATGEKIIPKHWSNGKAKSSMTGYDRLNDHLLNIESDLIQLWRDNKSDLSKIKSLMPAVVRGSSSTSQKKTIFEALERFLQECESGKSDNTLKMYRSLQAKLIAFDQLYPIDFVNLDFNFYDKFKRWLYEQPNPNYTGCSLFLSDSKDCYLLSYNDRSGIPVGLFDDTVFKYFTNLKAFIAWAEKRGYSIHQSYKTWEIIKRKHDPISLTLDELEKLEVAQMPNKSLEIARDYLVLECRTGQRISDLKRFDVLDYSEHKWTHHPKKGNRLSAKTVSVHFKGYCAPALLILGRYNFKLPAVHEVTLNKNIKEACKVAGINTEMFTERWAGSKKIRISGRKYEFMSTHIGRATFITLALSHGLPVEYVMELTGISEYQTLSHYRAKFDDKSVEKYLEGVSEQMTLMRKAQ
jgi:site-specific recombinase XerD